MTLQFKTNMFRSVASEARALPPYGCLAKMHHDAVSEARALIHCATRLQVSLAVNRVLRALDEAGHKLHHQRVPHEVGHQLQHRVLHKVGHELQLRVRLYLSGLPVQEKADWGVVEDVGVAVDVHKAGHEIPPRARQEAGHELQLRAPVY